MSVESAAAANFTGSGNFEAFFCRAIGFHFWHGYVRKKGERL
jgi:hypothetical protein